MKIHPTAVIDSSAQIGKDAQIGPFTVIGAGVRLGQRCKVGSHTSLEGPLEIGDDNTIEDNVVLGKPPQIKAGSQAWGGVRIGARNVLREFATVHRATSAEGYTAIGDDCYLMVGTHVAHDAVVGNSVVLCNGCLLAGHVRVDDGAVISALVGVHQHCRIGSLSMVGGLTAITKDVPPFALVAGERPARLHGINVIGLRRAGVPPATRRAIKVAYRQLFSGSQNLGDRFGSVDLTCPEVARLVEFVRASRRGLVGFGGGGSRRSVSHEVQLVEREHFDNLDSLGD